MATAVVSSSRELILLSFIHCSLLLPLCGSWFFSLEFVAWLCCALLVSQSSYECNEMLALLWMCSCWGECIYLCSGVPIQQHKTSAGADPEGGGGLDPPPEKKNRVP